VLDPEPPQGNCSACRIVDTAASPAGVAQDSAATPLSAKQPEIGSCKKYIEGWPPASQEAKTYLDDHIEGKGLATSWVMKPPGFPELLALQGLNLPSPPSSAFVPAVRPAVPVLFEHLQDSVIGHHAMMMKNLAQRPQRMTVKRSFPCWTTPFRIFRTTKAC